MQWSFLATFHCHDMPCTTVSKGCQADVLKQPIARIAQRLGVSD